VNLEILLVEEEVLEVPQAVVVIVVVVIVAHQVKRVRARVRADRQVPRNQVVEKEKEKVVPQNRAVQVPNPKAVKVKQVKVSLAEAIIVALARVKVIVAVAIVGTVAVVVVAHQVKRVRARVRVDHLVPRNQAAVKERVDTTTMVKTYSISKICMEYQDFLYAFDIFLKDLCTRVI